MIAHWVERPKELHICADVGHLYGELAQALWDVV
jgi:hypothetical protein